ncbi:MAG: D-Ala-D-Ala carboxypeptidase family metallohydrolase [Bacteroidota bacterium]
MKLQTLVFYLFFFSLCYYLIWIFDPIFSVAYDLFTQQSKVESKAQIDQSLAQFNRVLFEDLPKEVKVRFSSKSSKVCYGKGKQELYSGLAIYQIKWFERYRYIVGDFRVKDFLSGNDFFIHSDGFPHLAKTQYLVLDEAVLYKIHGLRQLLRKNELDETQMRINSGFRPPHYNEAVGGKVCSRHQFGDAVDLIIYDINRDGKSNAKDAKIVYDLLDQHIIGNGGGLGKYKSNRNVLHIDTRGSRARWYY